VKGLQPVAVNKHQLWWLLLPLFWLSMGLALPQLTVDALWHDEFMAYYRSGGGELEPITFMETLARTAEDFSWPPGYYLILAQWKQVSGGSLFADRLLQVFTGLLTLAVLYQLGKTLFSKRVAYIAAILLATSAVFSFYMHELRGHVLYVLSVALCLWSYWLVLQDKDLKYRWRQVFFLLSLVLALYAHYVATAAVIGIGLYHLLFERNAAVEAAAHKTKPVPVERATNWNRITFLGVLGIGIYGPWLGVLILSLVRRAVYYEPEVHTITALTVWFYIFGNGIIYLGMLPLALVSLRWIQQRALRFIWFWTLLVLLFNVVTNIWTDFLFHPRHLLILLLPICLTLAFMLDKIWNWQPIVSSGVLLIWIGAGLFHSIAPGFMDVIPTQIPTLPLTTISDLQAVSATCVAPDETVIFALVATEHEFIYQVPYFYYFSPYHYRFANLVQMQNIRDGELQDLYDLSYEEKVNLMTAGQTGIWLFTNPTLSQQNAIDNFETVLTAEGYTACPTRLTQTGFQGSYYTQGDTPQCERVVTCAGQ
jgi:Dolichyl-phosphate-mannose-protein mannosyltransferase